MKFGDLLVTSTTNATTSLCNLTPADVFYARGDRLLERREFIKQNTLAMRKQMHSANQTRSLTW